MNVEHAETALGLRVVQRHLQTMHHGQHGACACFEGWSSTHGEWRFVCTVRASLVRSGLALGRIGLLSPRQTCRYWPTTLAPVFHPLVQSLRSEQAAWGKLTERWTDWAPKGRNVI